MDLITAAVIELGFENASLTNVAQHLGAGHGALYRYIGDRDGMMREALERLTASYPWPELADDRREVLRNESKAWWALCTEYPGFVGALASTPGLPAAMSRRTLLLAKHLNELGVSAADAVMVVDLTTSLVHNIFKWAEQREAIIEQTLAMSVDEAMAQIEGIPDEIVGVLGTVLAGEIWPWYAGQLEIILDGLDARNPPAESPSPEGDAS